MAGLNFADSHNMVAYLEKSTENADFAEIVDFLNANPIRYALTVSPTIYVSCIEQFWSTAKTKTVNNETQIHAKVEGKTIVISESSMRRDLQFDDEDEPITIPSSSQPKKTHRSRKAKRATEISHSSRHIPLVADETVTKKREDRMERASTTAFILEAEQDSGNINRTQSMATLNEPSPHGTGSSSGPRVNTLESGEDRLKLKELMDLSTKLSDRVLDLETTKTAQAKKIASLKKRVKKLERKKKSKTPGMNLFKIGTSIRRILGFNTNMDEVFKDVEGDAEQVISAYADEGSTSDAINTAGTEVNTTSALITTGGVSISTAEPITTASVNITTAKPSTPSTTTTTVFEDEDLIIAQTLVKMRSEKSKVRGVVMQERSKTTTRPTIPPQQHDPKDKGKGKMVEQEKPLKKKDQIMFDEEIAQRLQAQMQAELEEEERLAREREEDANIAEWDNTQAMMDADYKLAARIQAQEQEELTIEEKSRLFVELMDKRKKHFARLRAEKKTTNQSSKEESNMYLFEKHGWIHSQSEVKIEQKGSETRVEGSSKRAGEDLQQESTKKQKMDDDKEKEELKQCFEIVLDDGDDVTIDATPLSIKIPIVKYKIYHEGKKSFFQIIRADGKTQMYLTFSKMLKNFDRVDLEALWRIVKARFKKTEPVNYMDIFLHLNLKTMFEHHIEDSIWKNQQG
ncbi:hypothetical protein Tco_0189366 [Tanacetum coccineum]